MEHKFSTRLFLFMLVSAGALTSCSVDKYLRPGEKLMYGNQVEFYSAAGGKVSPDVKQALGDAERYCSQKQNKLLLGMRIGMRLYCSTNPADTGGWSRFWRRQGEPPVAYDQGAAIYTVSQLGTQLKNKGCFDARVSYDTVARNASSVYVRYSIWSDPRYKVSGVAFRCSQPEIDSLLHEWSDESVIKAGQYYDRDLLVEERGRIAGKLREEGFFYASEDLVFFEVDTAYGSRELTIDAVVRIPGTLPDAAADGSPCLRRYSIDNVYIYPNIATDISSRVSARRDTLVYPYEMRNGISNFYFIHDGKISPKPKTVCRSQYFYHGQPYRPRVASLTSSALYNLQNFKYVDISYGKSPNSTDTTPLLDVSIRLLNTTKRRVSLSLELTNGSEGTVAQGRGFFTSGNIGVGTVLGYKNKNLFGGAEVLDLEGSLLAEIPKSVFGRRVKTFDEVFNTFENGLSASLTLPSFLIPFSSHFHSQSIRPHTLFTLKANYLHRKLLVYGTDETLKRLQVGGGFGYTWNYRRNITHKLLPINLSYTRVLDGWDYYTARYLEMKDTRFASMAESYMLLNTHYEFQYTNQHESQKQNFCYLHTTVETAGNLLNGVIDLFGWRQTSTNRNDTLTFCQYFLLSNEFKQYIYWDEKNLLVLRALCGFALPYGNSTGIPYEKQFVGGGPTTLRGWTARRLGPGQTFNSASELISGTGDVQLVFNVEERFPIYGIFEGAVFLDAGNVWSCTDWGVGKDARFVPSEIVKGIALDGGVGLRLNVSILTLRLDFAIPLYDPGNYYSERWISRTPKSSPYTFNFGVNYPF